MGSITHSEAPQVSVQLGLKSRSFESFVNRPKTVRGSILVPLGIAPDSDREHQGETFLGWSTLEVQAECGVDGTCHGLNPLEAQLPQDSSPRTPLTQEHLFHPSLSAGSALWAAGATSPEMWTCPPRVPHAKELDRTPHTGGWRLRRDRLRASEGSEKRPVQGIRLQLPFESPLGRHGSQEHHSGVRGRVLVARVWSTVVKRAWGDRGMGWPLEPDKLRCVPFGPTLLSGRVCWVQGKTIRQVHRDHAQNLSHQGRTL